MNFGHKPRLFDEWATAQEAKLAQGKQLALKLQRKVSKQRVPVTELQAQWLNTLGHNVTFGVGSPDKRFARNMADAKEITHGQALYLSRLVYKYRRQFKLTDASAERIQAELTEQAKQVLKAVEQE